MAWGDLSIVVEVRRLEGGRLELEFRGDSPMHSGWITTITKEAGETLEDGDFPDSGSVRAPWMFRLFHGLGRLEPVLKISDRMGASVWFYLGWDRKQRERIYLFSRQPRRHSGDTGEMMVEREKFAEIVRQLRSL